MPPDSGPKSVRGGLSLYANLLDPSCKTEASSSTISRAPVVFQQPLSEDTRQDTATIEKQQLSAGRYQPASLKGYLVRASRVGSRFLSCLCITQLP